jgi:glucose uptake protein GlcU
VPPLGPGEAASAGDAQRHRQLHLVGVWSGLAAGAWLGAAEAPTKLVVIGLSPVLVSFCMVLGVFAGRWSLPALVHGTGYVRADVRQAPHLVIWAVLGGCLWAVANTLTVFAIRDVGLSIAFPLWNTNSLIGVLWGVLFFNELRGAKRSRRTAVIGGAIVMCVAATAVAAAASGGGATSGHAVRGVVAALTAGVLWGTMYIPYRKAYITGLSPLSFLTFFTIGELGTMGWLAVDDAGGWLGLYRALVAARPILVWLLAGGFVWVIGDVFQQYAAKYIGISRGIPLSNTNQLWGLLWGVLVFGELRTAATHVIIQLIGGSILMVLGAGLIALAGADDDEREAWRAAAEREGMRYGVDDRYIQLRRLGLGPLRPETRRTWVDWAVVTLATGVFAALAFVAVRPQLPLNTAWAIGLAIILVATAVACGVNLWRQTRFV